MPESENERLTRSLGFPVPDKHDPFRVVHDTCGVVTDTGVCPRCNVELCPWGHDLGDKDCPSGNGLFESPNFCPAHSPFE